MTPVPDTASYIRGWMQMVLTPNDLFSWNNKYNEYVLHYYIMMDSLPTFQLCTSIYTQLTLCMLGFLSREGVVFFIFLPSSHFTEIHVLSPPVSEANWRFLFRPGDSPPTLSKMASSYTGSAHPPFPGYDTTPAKLAGSCLAVFVLDTVIFVTITDLLEEVCQQAWMIRVNMTEWCVLTCQQPWIT